jgi:protein involved in polysaccharide export with SLBB domain
MKRLTFLLLGFLLLSTGANAQMSDQQVIQFAQAEYKAGTSQAQIVTKLMQKGVKIEQIRRLRSQYDQQISQKGASAAADAAVQNAEDRMRTNNETGAAVEGGADGTAMMATSAVEEPTVVSGKAVYGHDIFNKKLLSFEPNMNIATPQNYVLGPGDAVIVDIFGASQKSESQTVTPDGTIVIEGYGPIKVAGLTVAAAQNKLRSTLGSRYKSSKLNVSVGQTRTILVNVMGEVKAPGTYTLSAFSTVFHALYMAGGIKDLGTLRNIKVYRGGRLVTSVDVYQYILNGRLAGNIRLQENDMIIVGPYEALVDIQGNVKRPMIYEMRPTESVAQAIKYAGGYTSEAYQKAIRLTRKSGDRFSVHTVGEFDMSAFKVTDGDEIQVESMIERYENMVEVEGAVFRPGRYEYGKQINTVRALVEAAGGLTEDAFTGRAVLYRMKQDRTLETQSLDLGGIMSGALADIPLRNEDQLIIATLSERASNRTVTITGEVFRPGTFPYSERETIEDLVLRAGGLTDAASYAKVDVSRRIRDPKALQSGQEISKNYSFSLKDGLVVDGQPGFTLEPYDVVQVRRSPGFMDPRTVQVLGEVVFEGDFNLSKKNQRLSDLIKAAGGVTPEAYVKGARLERHLNEDERARIATLVKTAQQTASSRDSISLEKIETAEYYAVGINLEKALANPGGDYDIVVRDGDRILVPEYNGTVRISGNVLFPNTVAYQAGKDWKYYVNQAGGFGQRSRKSHSFIIYQNGTVSQVGKGKVEPGCEIVVPQKGKRDMSALMQWVSIGTSMASLATMAATIGNLLK